MPKINRSSETGPGWNKITTLYNFSAEGLIKTSTRIRHRGGIVVLHHRPTPDSITNEIYGITVEKRSVQLAWAVYKEVTGETFIDPRYTVFSENGYMGEMWGPQPELVVAASLLETGEYNMDSKDKQSMASSMLLGNLRRVLCE
jgi:hypothetical protein